MRKADSNCSLFTGFALDYWSQYFCCVLAGNRDFITRNPVATKRILRAMLKATDTKHAPWYILRSDDNKRARLNCLRHILNLIPHKELPREKVKLPTRSMKGAYDDEASLKGRKFVPEKF